MIHALCSANSCKPHLFICEPTSCMHLITETKYFIQPFSSVVSVKRNPRSGPLLARYFGHCFWWPGIKALYWWSTIVIFSPKLNIKSGVQLGELFQHCNHQVIQLSSIQFCLACYPTTEGKTLMHQPHVNGGNQSWIGIFCAKYFISSS